MGELSRRSYSRIADASSWEELWEAGPYYVRISEVLEDARKYAIFAGWQIDSRLPLPRPFRPGMPAELAGGQETLKEKIIRLCESKPGFEIYFLMWDHAYFYCLERETWQGRVWENVHPRVHFIFDNRHPFGASHHEKVCIVDGTIAFCGGIDLCDERWDTPQHLFLDPRRSLTGDCEHHGPYHDMAVQVTGPVCGELQNHIARRWRLLSSIPFPDPPVGTLAHLHGGHSVYVSRTISPIEPREEPPLVREIEFLFRDLIQAARHRIILEGQYYWSREVNDLLIAKMRRMQGQDFEIIVILTDLKTVRKMTRQMTAHEMRLLEELERAARESGTRLTLGMPYAFPPGAAETEQAKAVYIHSKVLIIDDRYLSIGSANFASRALRVDTEIHMTLEGRSDADRAHIRKFADQLLSHWNREDTRLRLFSPERELERLPWLAKLVPWQLFFDPSLPFLYSAKRKYRLLAHRSARLAVACIVAVWLLGALVAMALSGAFARGHWALAWCALLSSTWVLPVPFVLASFVATIQLGGDAGGLLIFWSLWSAATLGYVLTRMFPSTAARFYRKTGPQWLPQRLGLREFPAIVSVLADPRVSVRSKIAYQGLYCVPFPWFALGTWIVLPAAIQVACRYAAMAAPKDFREWTQGNAKWVFAALAALSLGKVIGKLWKNGR